jgi:hypothetical protein
MNLTVTEPAGPGFLTAYPCGTDLPLVSNVNFVAGQTVPNLTTVRIGDGRSVCVYSSVPTHVVVDLAGAYGPDGSSLTPVVPQRLLDTRSGTGGWVGVLASGQSIDLAVGGAAGIPASATGAVLNVTITDTDVAGFVTVYPCGAAVPLASNLNYVAGDTRANMVITRLGTGGKVCLYTNGHTNLIVDIAGYLS